MLRIVLPSVLLSLALHGCGGGDAGAPVPAAPAQPAAAVPAAAPQASGLTAPAALAPPPAAASSPPLLTPPALLANSLRCSSGVDGANRSPVLLVHGTALDAKSSFSWNWQRALPKAGIPHCTIELPQLAMGDIQTAAEYVVYAVREMARRSRQKVQIVGHSQGGMLPRWALRFWPDIRPLVDDLVSLSASNHGTLDAQLICVLPCAPAIWQQRPDSALLAALNQGFETLPEVSYTSIYTRIDEVVVPNVGLVVGPASSALRDSGNHVRNIATQDICPLNAADHFLIGTADAVAYAVALDALTHDGPARPERVHGAVCLDLFMPGVNPLTFLTDFANLVLVAGGQVALGPKVTREPPLRCYVNGSC